MFSKHCNKPWLQSVKIRKKKKEKGKEKTHLENSHDENLKP